MKIGDKVIYKVDDTEFLGIIIAKTANLFKVSILALGKVIDSDGSDLEVL